MLNHNNQEGIDLMNWVIAFISAAVIGVSGMFYTKYYLKQKDVKLSVLEKKIAVPAICVFYLATAVLMALFTKPLDSTGFIFARDMVLLHSLFYIAYIDFKVKLIPNKAVLALLGMFVVLITVQCICEKNAAFRLSEALLGCCVAGGIFLIGNLISRNGMGMGDVKLMAVAGLYLGMSKALGLIFWALLLSAVTGIILMVAKKAKFKSTIPLAPFFLAGSLISNTLYIISGYMEV